MIRRFLSGAALVSAVQCLAFGADAQVSGLGAAAGPTPLSKHFTLVYNVNNAGYVDVCGCKHKEQRQGSLTRRSSFLKQIRSTGRCLVLLDGGSSLFPIGDRVKDEHQDEAVRKARLIVEAYNRMKYQAMCVGPFDLAAGFDVLKDLEKKAEFKLLSANLFDKETGELLFTPHTIISSCGVRVGVVGLTLETMSTRGYLDKVAPRLEARDPKEALRTSLAALEGKVDLVVALSHLKEETNRELIEAFPEVEILIDPYIEYGNHHTWIKEHEWLTSQGDTAVLRSDGQGARMGVLDIEMAAGSRQPLVDTSALAELEARVTGGEATAEDRDRLQDLRRRNRYHFQRISLEPHHLSDPEIDFLVAEWKKNVDPSKVAALEQQLPHKSDYLTTSKCAGCHQKQYEWWKGTKHAHALASLRQTGDHQRFDCVGCHTLGYGRAFLDTTEVGIYADVQCESCHGTNPQHAAQPAEHRFGRLSRKDCIVCHNKEQTLREFRFAQARRMVACPKG